MKRTTILVAALCLSWGTAARGGGFAHNEHYLVLAPEQALAEEVLSRAGQFRQEIAYEWLAAPPEDDCGPTMIEVKLSAVEDKGLTWDVEHDGQRHHRTWLRTSRQRALGSTLRHELVHSVLSAQFGDAIPKWAEEGAASMSDDAGRIDRRHQLVEQFARTGRWPDLAALVEAKTISREDESAYALAGALTEYLVSLADKPTFVRFAVDSASRGWTAALEEHYGLHSIEEFEAGFRAWASGYRGRLAADSAISHGGRLSASSQYDATQPQTGS